MPYRPLGLKKAPLRAGLPRQQIHVGIADDMEVALQKVLHIQVCLPLLEVNICEAHDKTHCGNEDDHVVIFSLFKSVLWRAYMMAQPRVSVTLY
jgi:hypothetical protein